MSSCLVQSFKEHASLTDHEVELLSGLEKTTEDKSRGTILFEQGQEPNSLYVMSKGWSYNYVDSADGNRQILDINLPGDIIGMRDIACHRSTSSLKLVTDGTVCVFERNKLNDLFSASGKLVGIFFLIAMRRESLMTERVVNLGRRDAFQRLCHLIVELRARLQCVNSNHVAKMRLPFTQVELAGILGMSEVHVSRTLRQLKQSGLVSMSNGTLTINELDDLITVSEFDPTYLEINRSWLMA